MSRKKCCQAKIFQELGVEAVLEHSDCRHQSGNSAGSQVGSARADQTAKITNKRRANISKTDKRVG
jgi:hypothetical protein